MNEFSTLQTIFLTAHHDIIICGLAIYALQYWRHSQNFRLTKNNSYVSHLDLILWSFIFCFFNYVTYLYKSPEFTLKLVHFMWFSGIVVCYYYNKTIQTFFRLESKTIDFCNKAILVLATIIGAIGLSCLITGKSPLFIGEETFTHNIFILRAGGNFYKPSNLIGLLGLPAFLLSIIPMIIFLKYALSAQKKDYVLISGILFSFTGAMTDTIVGTTAYGEKSGFIKLFFTYVPPMLSVSHLIEIFRISGIYHKQSLNQVFELEKELKEASSVASLGFIAGSITHDINNPLTVIKLYVEKITMDLKKQGISDPLLKMLKTVDINIDRIQKISVSYMELLRSAGERKVSRTLATEVIQNAMELAKPRLQKFEMNNVTIEGSTDIVLMTNLTHAELILVNLLNNAADVAKDLQMKWVKIICTSNDGFFEIRVRDSGLTPDPEIISKFFKQGFTTKAIGMGHGIGLNTAKKLAELNGGSLTLNTKSIHTEFVLMIPLA